MGAETAILIGANAASAVNNARAMRQQDRILAGGIETQEELQRQANERLMAELARLARSGPRAEIPAAQYRRVLGANNVQYAVPGAASDRFGVDMAAGQAKAGDFASRLADLFARIDATGAQRQLERFGIGRTAADMRGIAGEAEGEDYLTRLRASRVRPNPWIEALTGGTRGYAQAQIAGGI